MKAYLKCIYGEGGMSLSSEYSVIFKCVNSSQHPGGEGWCIVDREEVTPLGDNEGEEKKGLVRIVQLNKNEDGTSATAWLKDDGEMRLSPFTVPLEEVVMK